MMLPSTFTCLLLLAANAGCAECVSTLSNWEHQRKDDPEHRNAKAFVRSLHDPLIEAHSDPSNQVFYQLNQKSRQPLHGQSQTTENAVNPVLMRRAKKGMTWDSDNESSYPEVHWQSESLRELETKDRLEQLGSATGWDVKPLLMRRVRKASTNGSNAEIAFPENISYQSVYQVQAHPDPHSEANHHHKTEEDPDSEPNSTNKPNKSGITAQDLKSVFQSRMNKALLSPELQIFIGCLVTAFILNFYLLGRWLFFSPVPPWANSERVDTVLKETKARLEKLNIEYGNRLPEFERYAARGDPELLEEAERNIVAREEGKAKNDQIHAAAASVAQVPEKLQAQAMRAHGAFKEAVSTATERVEDITKREGAEVYEQLKEAVEERKLPDWEPPDWMAGDEDEFISMPPIGNLIRGAIAPARMGRLLADCEWLWMIDLAVLIASVIIFVVDEKTPCADKLVNDWMWGSAVSTLLDFLGRSALIKMCMEARAEMKANRATLAEENKIRTGNDILDAVDMFRRGSASYFDAYFRHTAIVDSWLYRSLRLAELFFLFWGGFGFYISVHNIVEDSLKCKEHLAVKWIHTYSFFWVMLLTWTSSAVIIHILGYIAGDKYFVTPIAKAAKYMDDSSFSGFPICLSLAETFILKNSSTQLAMLALEVRQDLADIEAQIQRHQRLLTQRRRVKDRLKDLSLSQGTEQDFMERSESKVQTALGQARPFVGLLAANVRSDTNPRNADRDNAQASPPARQTRKRTSVLGTLHPVQHEDNISEGSFDPTEAAAPDVEDF